MFFAEGLLVFGVSRQPSCPESADDRGFGAESATGGCRPTGRLLVRPV
jgi:hypothetical protein